MYLGLIHIILRVGWGFKTLKLNFWGQFKILKLTQNLVKFYEVKEYFFKTWADKI